MAVATPDPQTTVFQEALCAHCHTVIRRWTHTSGLDGKWVHLRTQSERCTDPT